MIYKLKTLGSSGVKLRLSLVKVRLLRAITGEVLRLSPAPLKCSDDVGGAAL